MKYRVLYISNPCYLSIKHANIVVTSKTTGATTVPIDEIAVVVLENNHSSMSAAFLSKLAENKIALFSCDESFMPNGIFLPYHQHSRFSEVSKLQFEWSVPLKKQLWQKIVINKIENQVALLKDFDFDTKAFLPYMSQVKSGDSENIEAIVASFYWKYIFSNSLDYFTRQADDIRNAALNYGYAILRGAIARATTASGFTPFFGLHHNNKLNSFNLIDDLIEPFRPIVDKEVYIMFEEELLKDEVLSKDIKRRLISLLEVEVYIEKKKYTLLSAIDTYINSLKNASTHKDSDLLVQINL